MVVFAGRCSGQSFFMMMQANKYCSGKESRAYRLSNGRHPKVLIITVVLCESVCNVSSEALGTVMSTMILNE